MVTTQSDVTPFVTNVQTPLYQLAADTNSENGGSGAGFRPHELLEASLASCLNMWLRMRAAKEGLPLQGVRASVQIRKDKPEETVFEYAIELQGELTGPQREQIMKFAEDCPVRQTLSRQLRFKRLQ